MSNFIKVVALLFVYTTSSFAQDVKFGKVSKEELSEKIYKKDSTADAAVLYRKIKVFFSYRENNGFVIEREVHERIKIYNNGGFKYATVIENLYDRGGSRESIYNLKAYTFNLVGNEIEKTKLKSSDTFTEESSKYYTKEKFTMPNLKEGSVIEYKYTVNSPFYSSFNEIILQYDIPILEQEINVAIPEYFTFKNITKGYLAYNIEKSSKPGSITFTDKNRTSAGGGIGGGAIKTNFTTSKLDYNINISKVHMVNVPSLKKELYVNSMNNYRSAIKYELQYVKFPNSSLENYSSSWEDVVKKIYKNEEFGNQLNFKKYYKSDLEKVVLGKASEKEKTNAVYSYVQSRMNWNGINGYYTDEGVKKAYDLKVGNVADINLMLVSMLRSAGLNANPVLVSTRSNGVPLFPTRYGFNYVVALVKIEGKNIFLDATSKYSKPNMLPVRALNWAGRIVKEGGLSASISLMPDYTSSENIMMLASISNTGDAEGKVRRVCKDYIAYNFRAINSDLSEEDYLEKLEENYNGIEISEYSIKNKEKVGKPILESFSFNAEDATEIIGDKMYLSPLFWLSQTENPFKKENREYPIDYGYPWEDTYSITIKIPKGYKIESVPESCNIVIGDDIGQYILLIAKTSDGLQIKSELKVNQAIIFATHYKGLKDFYNAMVEKQTEKVVLSKI
ncbi:DUF3857 domain-containing protein [uncultured Maribacter sp.]|uniref:DUF3857 domain-containing protein n=1 Tax=uncultured Maribacter sp. TaxID=431308 RepID=UPI00260AA2F6|nr:DUF3857 domain-containing protein [uncultured Maribacter sp.]